MVKVTADRQDTLAAYKETKQARFIGEARKLANVLVEVRSTDRHGSILVKETDEWTASHIPSSALKTFVRKWWHGKGWGLRLLVHRWCMRPRLDSGILY